MSRTAVSPRERMRTASSSYVCASATAADVGLLYACRADLDRACGRVVCVRVCARALRPSRGRPGYAFAVVLEVYTAGSGRTRMQAAGVVWPAAAYSELCRHVRCWKCAGRRCCRQSRACGRFSAVARPLRRAHAARARLRAFQTCALQERHARRAWRPPGLKPVALPDEPAGVTRA